ncbi:hypothetical protein VTO42DRAFT_7288 [Malbranchea cinnamomea]
MGDKSGTIFCGLPELLKAIFGALDRFLKLTTPPREPARPPRRSSGRKWRARRSLDGFSQEVQDLFTGHLTTHRLMSMSKQICAQLSSRAKTSPVCMLPSYNHALPTGKERGTYLALDLGGSTFRVALVELSGRENAIKIIQMASWHINESIKLLEGRAFFDWMAEKIDEMLMEGSEKYGQDSVALPVGLSWSFPIDQTSVRSGRVIAMGKGFLCSNGTVGEDLADLIEEACRKRQLNVRIGAIVNDSSATLLSRAYTDASTRMSLILGTGTNAAIHFPVHAIGIEKFGDRPAEWFAQAKHVIVNTELSMFGGDGVLPKTRWDDDLNRNHIKPDYQPLEYMATGRYLGEIVRLIIVEAVKSAGLFGGELPVTMESPYSLDTSIVACIEEDTSPLLQRSSEFLQRQHEFTIPPTSSDLLFIQRVCKAVSTRAAAYLAAAIHGLWSLRNECESPLIPSTPKSPSAKEGLDSLRSSSHVMQDLARFQVTIACDGSVINKYPNFREQCQEYLNQLTQEDDILSPPSPSDTDELPVKGVVSSVRTLRAISLDPAPESAIFGAAVAVAIAASGR